MESTTQATVDLVLAEVVRGELVAAGDTAVVQLTIQWDPVVIRMVVEAGVLSTLVLGRSMNPESTQATAG